MTQNPQMVQAMQNPSMPLMPNRSSMMPLTRLATMPLSPFVQMPSQGLGLCVIFDIYHMVHVVDRSDGEDGIGRSLHILSQCYHGDTGRKKQN